MGDQRASSGTTAQLSAKIMEAQVYFQKVVKQELQVLVASGVEREVAVKMLLRRIVQSTYEPEESDVKRVMRQFQMIHDDAVRALIVKQEIGRLKRQGLDAFAAIELLTRKMQGISVPDGDGSEEEKDDQSSEEPVHEEMSDQTSSSDEDSSGSSTVDVASPVTKMDESPHANDTQEEESSLELSLREDHPQPTDAGAEEQGHAEPAGKEPLPLKSPDASSATSLSLCERIDQVSISAASPDASQANAASSTTSPAFSTSHSAPRTAFTLFSAHSRKRRVTDGSSSPVNEVEEVPLSPRTSIPGASTASSHRPYFSMSRPMSPTFRFQKSKKQKIWIDNENDEPVLDTISLKETSIPPPASPTGVGTTSETAIPPDAATPTRVGKRRRSIRGSSTSPEIDEIDVEDPMLRVSKRHKLGAEINF